MNFRKLLIKMSFSFRPKNYYFIVLRYFANGLIFRFPFPGLRSLTYPGLFIFCPFRAKAIQNRDAQSFPPPGELEGGCRLSLLGEWEGGYSLFFESKIIVTGPSLVSETSISAPKMPVPIGLPSILLNSETSCS